MVPWWVAVLCIFVAAIFCFRIGKQYSYDNFHIGMYDVVNDILYYDDDVDPLNLEEEKPNVAVIDLIYLDPKRIAKRKGDI